MRRHKCKQVCGRWYVGLAKHIHKYHHSHTSNMTDHTKAHAFEYKPSLLKGLNHNGNRN